MSASADGPVVSSKFGGEESLQYVSIHSQSGGLIGTLRPALPRPLPLLQLTDDLPLLLRLLPLLPVSENCLPIPLLRKAGVVPLLRLIALLPA